MTRQLRIAVCGGGGPDAQLPLAEEVGARLADAGAIVICGGLGGVMEAVARGAHARGGLSVGLLPRSSDSEVNAFITVPLPTGIGEARNVIVATSAHALIAIGGEWGTLAEVAFAARIGRPVILLEPTLGRQLPLPVARDPEEAVRLALDAARAQVQHG